MTRLRDLERQAQADGTVESTSLWLAERLRVGALRGLPCLCKETIDVPGPFGSIAIPAILNYTDVCSNCKGTGTGDGTQTLRLLAYVGHEPARLLVNPMEFAPLGTWGFFDEEFDYWQRGIPDFGHVVAIRCALAASVATLPATGGCVFHTDCPHCVAVNAQISVQAYLDCPGHEHLLHAYAAGSGHELWYSFRDVLPNPPGFRMSQTPYTIEACAELMCEKVIRAAILAAMIEWCLE